MSCKRHKVSLVYSVGVNDSEIPVSGYDKTSKSYWKCPYYSRWKGMLERCYCPAYQRKYSSYKGVSVCDEWLYFTKFKEWMERQEWRGCHLDKDLLSGSSKIYSPDTCVFISPELNTFITERRDVGDLPLGVYKRKESGGYKAQYGTKPRRSLGTYKDPSLAHVAWQNAKIEHGSRLLLQQKDDSVRRSLRGVVDRIKDDVLSGKETVSILH